MAGYANALSSGGSGVGKLFNGFAQLQQATADYRVAKKNAAFLRQSAEFDLFKGQLDQMEVDRQAARVLAEQKVSYANQGVDLGSETVSQVREEALVETARVKNEVELNAAMAAWGKKTQADLNMETAKNNRRAARIGAAGNIVSGAGDLGAAALFL